MHLWFLNNKTLPYEAMPSSLSCLFILPSQVHHSANRKRAVAQLAALVRTASVSLAHNIGLMLAAMLVASSTGSERGSIVATTQTM